MTRYRLFTLAILTFSLLAAIAFSDNYFSIAQKIDTTTEFLAGTISGRVFQDFNADGVFDNSGGTAAAPLAVDTGVANVTVTAYDPGGNSQGSAVTNGSGIYSLVAGGTGPYRLEFTNLPSGFSPSARSTDSVSGGTSTNTGSTTQFVANGNTADVNLAINRPRDYCQNNPSVCSQVYEPLGANAPSAVFTIPYNAGSTRTTGGNPIADFTTPAQVSLADMNQVGTTFGLAYSRSTRRIFTSAYMKKHAAFGPGGTGAIYLINRGTGVVSQWANLNTIFGANTAGANPHNTADYNTDNGNATWDAAGKVAFGGLAINDGETVLYAMNLANRTLYEIPANTAPTSGNIRTSAFPATMPGCTNASDVRPFAVTFYEGLIYVGAVCSGDVSDARADVDAYVYTVNPATLVFSAAPVFQTPLDYTRGNTDPGFSANWLAWRTNFLTISGSHFIYPQPMLTDIDFDRGNLILSLRDRNGDQSGLNNSSNPNNFNQLFKGITAGEMLRACGNPQSGWTIENNGVCGTVVSGSTQTNAGPGGREYYYQEDYHPGGVPHDEVGNGAAHQIPGRNEMVATVFDPVYIPNDNIFDAGGFRWFVNSTGAQNRGYLVYSGDFAKANGMGNVIALCDAAPIEIGNRVWRDSNANGVQDAGEPAIANVTVRLYQGSTLIGTAVTDANGEFYFVSSTVADPNTADNIGQVNGGILPATAYQIRFDNPANYASGGPLFGLFTAIANQTSQTGDDDSSDSDAMNVTNPGGSPAGTFPVIAYTTGTGGTNNHTLDVGFRLTPSAGGVSVSGRVITTAGRGIRNVFVTLMESDGSTRTTLTGVFGYYRFDDITAGQAIIVSVSAKRYSFGNPTRALVVNEDTANLDFIADE